MFFTAENQTLYLDSWEYNAALILEELAAIVDNNGGTIKAKDRSGYEKWVDLKGFTEATLSRKDIEKKWGGCKFRCVVTDAEGTQIISREVTLTVRDRVDTGDHSSLTLYLAVALAALALLWLMRRQREAR